MRRGSTTPSSFWTARAGIAVLAILVTTTSLVDAARSRRGRSTTIAKKAAPNRHPRVQVGGASWYGPGFHGRRTASGERFNRHAMTLAHRSMPFGTRVRVTNLKTGRSVVGRVNDRGPFVRGRIVDLSQGMARRLGIGGTGKVKVEVLGADGQPLSQR